MALIACDECGKSISDRAPSCPHCGLPRPPVAATSPTVLSQGPQVAQLPQAHPPQPLPRQAPSFLATKASNGPYWFVLSMFGAFFLSLALFVATYPERPNTAEERREAADARRAAMAMPPDEANMVAIVQRGRQSYKAAASELQAGAARPDRARELCNNLRTTSAQDWKGKVSKLSTNSDGRGVLTVTIADNIEVTTWNNALSDIADKTLIDPNSPLYRAALRLTAGMNVKFSGEFVRSEVDCLRESSLTMNGSMSSPKFIFRFSQISPL